VILIVSIPEGLPLAISIAMALSIGNLKADAILIKNLEAVQTCAMIHDLCIGKTATLTEGGSEGTPMQVKKYHIMDAQTASDVDTMFKMVPFIELVKECIIANTDVRIETTEDNWNYELRGSAIEVGLVDLLLQQGMDIQETFLDRNEKCDKAV
jgi:P-type E1-E2 ATPase